MQRARVRQLVEVINSGTQPLQNLPVAKRARSEEKAQTEWQVSKQKAATSSQFEGTSIFSRVRRGSRKFGPAQKCLYALLCLWLKKSVTLPVKPLILLSSEGLLDGKRDGSCREAPCRDQRDTLRRQFHDARGRVSGAADVLRASLWRGCVKVSSLRAHFARPAGA